MQTADIIAVVSAVITFLALVVAFLSYRRQLAAARQATHEKFARMREEARVILAELETADAKLKQQPLMMLEDARAVFERARECGLPELRDRASELRDHVLHLSKRVEDSSRTYLSDLKKLHDMLEALPAQEAAESDIPELQRVVGLFQQQKVKVDQQHSDMSSTVSRYRKEIDDLGKTVDDDCKKEKVAAKERVKEVLKACNRRAVFTRTHAQLDHGAMFRSLDACRSRLQRIMDEIEDDEQKQDVARIIGQLDTIERHSEDLDLEKIDQAKLRIIASLKSLSKAAGVPYSLPPSTTEEVFFTLDEADQPPTGSHLL